MTIMYPALTADRVLIGILKTFGPDLGLVIGQDCHLDQSHGYNLGQLHFLYLLLTVMYQRIKDTETAVLTNSISRTEIVAIYMDCGRYRSNIRGNSNVGKHHKFQ